LPAPHKADARFDAGQTARMRRVTGLDPAECGHVTDYRHGERYRTLSGRLSISTRVAPMGTEVSA